MDESAPFRTTPRGEPELAFAYLPRALKTAGYTANAAQQLLDVIANSSAGVSRQGLIERNGLLERASERCYTRAVVLSHFLNGLATMHTTLDSCESAWFPGIEESRQYVSALQTALSNQIGRNIAVFAAVEAFQRTLDERIIALEQRQ